MPKVSFLISDKFSLFAKLAQTTQKWSCLFNGDNKLLEILSNHEKSNLSVATIFGTRTLASELLKKWD